jgi:hypothetical protein
MWKCGAGIGVKTVLISGAKVQEVPVMGGTA